MNKIKCTELVGVYTGGIGGKALILSGSFSLDEQVLPNRVVTIQFKSETQVQDIKTGMIIDLTEDQMDQVDDAVERLEVDLPGDLDLSMVPFIQKVDGAKLAIPESTNKSKPNPWEDTESFYQLDFDFSEMLKGRPVSISEKKNDSPLVPSLLDVLADHFGKKHFIRSDLTQVDFSAGKILVPYSRSRSKANALVTIDGADSKCILYPELGSVCVTDESLSHCLCSDIRLQSGEPLSKSELEMLIQTGAMVSVQMNEGVCEILEVFIEELGLKKVYTRLPSNEAIALIDEC